MSHSHSVGRSELIALTSEIVCAHLSGNEIARDELPQMIQSVFDTLSALATEPSGPVEHTPAVPIKRSVTDDYIVCLEDGRKLKMLKRYLRTTYGMTPEEYRAKWGLGPDYPMVAPNYARRRRELAKQIGLGRLPKQAAAPVEEPKPRRARKKAAA